MRESSGVPSTKSSSRAAARGRRPARRGPLATIALLVIGLAATGGVYSLFTATASADSATTVAADQVGEGQKLYQANCASCHGLQLEGTDDAPTLVGVGAAAVDFQVGTGRMPAAASGPQAEKKPVQFTDDQVKALAAYVATIGVGPAIPAAEYTDGEGDPAHGGELFRTNCAMCHNVAGAGGALTEGKFAPALTGVTGTHIYEAMLTGPQNMPVFNDLNLSPTDKKDIIAYLKYLEANPSPGGFELGNLGPVAEGLFIWIFGLGAVVAVTVWLTAKSN
ncbi:c-type cytochrome [Galbitalea sp. SE-J8]|uniref:cytochrome bc1 complex diheme cytochrome c subunit n=1 Tax=Galbitalea sp. SE-J8 TaxID=3054952 RepID=UPI00259C6CA9|nr:c-type cytochrome [Galbitalea sp. SE-J8]MDM4763984.1 c-type cytochrome [Galbitalea sp. SE-J8]